MDVEAKHKLDKLCDDVCDIKTALTGDDYGNPGLVRRVHRLEHWRDAVTLKLATVTGVVLTVGFVVKYLLTGKW